MIKEKENFVLEFGAQIKMDWGKFLDVQGLTRKRINKQQNKVNNRINGYQEQRNPVQNLQQSKNIQVDNQVDDLLNQNYKEVDQKKLEKIEIQTNKINQLRQQELDIQQSEEQILKSKYNHGCEICVEKFDQQERKALQMKCGHLICENCLNQIKSEKTLQAYIAELNQQEQMNAIMNQITNFQKFNNYTNNQRYLNYSGFNESNNSYQYQNECLGFANQFQYGQQYYQQQYQQQFQQQQLDKNFNQNQILNEEQLQELVNNYKEYFVNEIEVNNIIQCPFCRINIDKASSDDLKYINY
ncbi:hypothetical protein PPERSA_02023 [Pseudocohnilembus persalinus]|uniref:RING-type domain-containing protein n=1 Tax=Pseudocohnilembus persalinus TaxID=266149 RepID=A0A0V0QFA1_PSEPJ|nr:hypothetical protein PPERSA_02023 [Pseudocohnilembus persalinus]|eukprot:KRX00844.1 hypothetical protein PPERSA_02023 [Pseudocohnilembus persalinus]